jgi:hypothetical protein
MVDFALTLHRFFGSCRLRLKLSHKIGKIESGLIAAGGRAMYSHPILATLNGKTVRIVPASEEHRPKSVEVFASGFVLRLRSSILKAGQFNENAGG